MESIEAGIVLTGTEVKSLRTARRAWKKPTPRSIDEGEVWLYGCDIPSISRPTG